MKLYSENPFFVHENNCQRSSLYYLRYEMDIYRSLCACISICSHDQEWPFRYTNTVHAEYSGMCMVFTECR